VNFQEWFTAHRRRNPNAKINERTRDLYRAWLRNNPRDPGEGGPGAGRVPGLTPEMAQPQPQPQPQQPSGPSAPAQPSPPAAPRIDAGREREILNLVDQRNLLPADYNRQRNRSATNFRTGLLDNGYSDTVDLSSDETTTDAQGNPLARYMQFNTINNPSDASAQQVRQLQTTTAPAGTPRPEGNISYRLSLGPDGRIYRQAYMRNADTFAARGVSGSLVSDAQRQSRQSIDTARDRSIQNYNDAVRQINQNQTNDDLRLSTAITTGNTGYSQWTGQQDTTLGAAPSPSTPAPSDTSGANNVVTPTPPAPPATSGNLGTWRASAVGANAVPRLTRQVRNRLDRTGQSGATFRIVRRGNRYVAVRAN
jgi:hypothetical protein